MVSGRISSFLFQRRFFAGVFALLFFAAPLAAYAGNTGTVDQSYDRNNAEVYSLRSGELLQSASVMRARLPRGYIEAGIETRGICRYFTNNNNSQDYFVPIGSTNEWLSFIHNAPNDVSVLFCRPAYTASIDFTSSSIPASSQVTTALGKIFMSGTEQWMVVSRDTTSTTLTKSYPIVVAANLTETISLPIQYSRQDCRTNRDHNGNLRSPSSVCSSVMWIETGNAKVEFKKSGESTRATNASPGAWTLTPQPKSGTPPAFNPPAIRTCPPKLHGQTYWVDGSTSTRLASSTECPYGSGSRVFSWTQQLEYICFDGTAEPTGGTRNTPEVDSGVCTQAKDCVSPWGGFVANGSSVTAYLSSTAASCQSETRVCNNGVLSGSYTNQSCESCGNTSVAWSGPASCAAGGLSGSGGIFGTNTVNTCNNSVVGSSWSSVSGCCVPNQLKTASFNVNGITVAGCDEPKAGCPAGTAKRYGEDACLPYSVVSIYDATPSGGRPQINFFGYYSTGPQNEAMMITSSAAVCGQNGKGTVVGGAGSVIDQCQSCTYTKYGYTGGARNTGSSFPVRSTFKKSNSSGTLYYAACAADNNFLWMRPLGNPADVDINSLPACGRINFNPMNPGYNGGDPRYYRVRFDANAANNSYNMSSNTAPWVNGSQGDVSDQNWCSTPGLCKDGGSVYSCEPNNRPEAIPPTS